MTKKKVSKKSDRKERVPFGAMRQKLQVDENAIPGYRLYWFSDKDLRIQDAEAAGYEFVYQHEIGRVGERDVLPDQLDQGEKVIYAVDTTEQGLPLIGYLMKIKKQWYEKDKKAKALRLAEMEESLKQPNTDSSQYNTSEVPGGMSRS